MRYPYPRRNNYLLFQRAGKNEYEIRNILTDEILVLDYSSARLLYKLDGKTNPMTLLNIPKCKIKEILQYFDEEGLLFDERRVFYVGFGTVMLTLACPNIKKWTRLIARIWNWLLLIFWIPVFAAGLFSVYYGVYRVDVQVSMYYIGWIIGLLIGLFMHEISHGASCLAYGGYLFEFGVMIKDFLPAAYVILDYENVKNSLKKAQINAAGVEANFFLAGVFSWLMTKMTDGAMICFAAAITNVLLAFVNLLLIDGIDGMAILGELLGDKYLFDKAKRVVKSKKYRRKIKKRRNGRAVVLVSYLLVFFQIMFPVLFIANLLIILGGGI